jgi:hypothetical protein
MATSMPERQVCADKYKASGKNVKNFFQSRNFLNNFIPLEIEMWHFLPTIFVRDLELTTGRTYFLASLAMIPISSLR